MEDSNEYLTSSDSSSGSGEPQRINRYYLALSEEGNIRQVSENDHGDIYPINLPRKRVTSETYFFGKTPAAIRFETELYSSNSDDHNTRLKGNENMSKPSEEIQHKPSCSKTSRFVKSNEPDKDLEALEVITESDRVENVADEESLDTTEYEVQIANHLATLTKEMEKYEEMIADESLQTSESDKVLEAIHLITESDGVENVVAEENHGAGECNKQTDATHVTTEAMEIDRNGEIRANESHQTSGKDSNQKESTGTRKHFEISYNFEDRIGGQTGSKASTNQGIHSLFVPRPSNVPEAPESPRQTGFEDSLASDADSDLDARSPSHLSTRATESNGDGNHIPTSMIPEDLANSTYRTVTHRDQGTQTHLEATASNKLMPSSPTISVNESEILSHNILQYSNGWRQLHTHIYQETAAELSYQCSDCAKQEMEMSGRCFHFQLEANDNIYFCKCCGYIHSPNPNVFVPGSGNVMISENRTPKATQICTENLAKQIYLEDSVEKPKEPLIRADNAVNECENVANVSTADVNPANIHETSIFRLDLSVPKYKNSNVKALKRNITDKARLQLEAECRVVV
ncbi:unnamed protein product [Orchesella dallaii]|uniref:Uncharacterized protein n=1 Tax=Orchesella dallaii TaxID=48710 RepID=A0ABP1QXV7_9HEXA